MDRRKFVQNSSLLATLPFIPPIGKLALDKTQKPDWLVRLILLNDEYLKKLLPDRIGDPSLENYGGFINNYQFVNEHSTVAFVKSGITSLVTEESSFYNDSELLSKLNDAVLWLLKVQNSDGSINLYSTNFNSPPDTGFFIKWLGPIYKLLMESDVRNKETLMENLKLFMIRAGNALTVGGIHTPNHRWVVCAALAWLYMLWPDPKYRSRAEQWLAEGIDIDVDGQYHEKSSHVYTPLTDRNLIIIARGFDKPELLDYVRKNLDMTEYYLHPNGEVITEVSGRQDRARIGTMEGYYFPYRYLALHDDNQQFAAMCKLIEETAFDKISGPSLHYILEDQSLWKKLPKPSTIPEEYERYFKDSGLVHIRRGDYDGSIIALSPSFFTFHKMDTAIHGVRLASAFFGKGQFSSEELVKDGDSWKLERDLEGPYYQPLSEDLVTGENDWNKTPRNLRKKTEIQKLKSIVNIREIANGFELEINIEGTDRVPVTLELIFRPGGTFSGLEKLEEEPDSWLLKEGIGTYSNKGSAINFGPGTYGHKWIRLRGALPGEDAPTAFLTGFTPFRHKIVIS
ncbi:MAG: hypothetical protein ACFHWX_15655 [Bacteroidota bacterium]